MLACLLLYKVYRGNGQDGTAVYSLIGNLKTLGHIGLLDNTNANHYYLLALK